jgi:hypothetical protein
MRTAKYAVLNEDDTAPLSNQKDVASRKFSVHTIINSVLILALVIVVGLEHKEMEKNNIQHIQDTSALQGFKRLIFSMVVCSCS